ncbi:MAG: 1-deoxy-D-xylulose-5-phosphate reductoisomerase [Desulfovibrio sp.]|nr:1-deoxy-D-xylulose-5-phosphate reductoisomerase [Desulfovibrio sp.]
MRYISGLPQPQTGKGPRVLAVLGSTGSIGRSALEVVRLHPQRFRVASLAGGRNMERLAAQAEEFRPALLCAQDEESAQRLRSLLPRGLRPNVLVGSEGCAEAVCSADIDMVVSAQSGAIGLRGTYAAACSGKIIALANKESLVLAGRHIREACARSGASVLPVDSEHNALFQCLAGSDGRAFPTEGRGFLRRLILTASGGPFFGRTKEETDQARPDQALKHPTWNMGARISIDSATLMNKGLELIEAHHLFGLPMADMDVVIHRESVVHSLAEFTDGSLLAQLGAPDMRIPLSYCLGFPERLYNGAPALDLAALGSLHFSPPDRLAFPCLDLARSAGEKGDGYPVVLNAANEVAVDAFLAGRIPFGAIPGIVERCLDAYGASRARLRPENSGSSANCAGVSREEELAKRRKNVDDYKEDVAGCCRDRSCGVRQGNDPASGAGAICGSAVAPAPGGADAGDAFPGAPDTIEAVPALDAAARVRARREAEFFAW